LRIEDSLRLAAGSFNADLTPPDAVDDMIRAADSVLYFVKHAGKDGIKHAQREYRAAWSSAARY
jgi:hypothetical protein